MAYNEQLNDRIREALSDLPEVLEKYMFGGSCFMVNGKMCVGVVGDEMMCRIDHDVYDKVIEKVGCRPMDFTGKPMKGYVFVSNEVLKSNAIFNEWLQLCLDFNSKAKASKKKKK